MEKKNESEQTAGGGSSVNEKSASGMTVDDIRNLQKQLQLQETLLTGLQEENESLYSDLKNQEITKKDFQSKVEIENKQLLEKIDNLKMNNQVDIEKLQKKLKWYAENQSLIDRDKNELKTSRTELMTLVRRLEQESKNKTTQ